MTRYKDPTPEEARAWEVWLAERPEAVRAVAERFNPWSLYRLRTTGHRCFVESFNENDDGSVTVTVGITGEFNLVTFERAVFGINPDELEPCELPVEGEPLGVILKPEEVPAHLEKLRQKMGPE